MGKSSRIREERKANLATAAAAPKEKAKNPIWGKLAIVLAVLVVIALIVVIVVDTRRNSGTELRNTDAIKVGDQAISAAEVDFYFNALKYQYKSYNDQVYASYGIQLYNVNFDKDLFTQTYDETTGLSWGDFLVNAAVEQVQQYSAMEQAGKKAGFEMPEAYAAEVESSMAALESSAKSYNVSAGTLLKSNYGDGITVDLYKELITREVYANAYASSVYDGFEVTDSAINDEYVTNKNDYDLVSYRTFTVNVELPEHKDANGQTYSDDATKAEDQQIIADKMLEIDNTLKDVKTEDEFVAAGKKLNVIEEGKEANTLQSGVSFANLSESIQSWMFDATRQPGDLTLITGTGYISAYFFVSRDDRSEVTRNVRHILLKAADKNDADQARAQAIVDEYNAGAKTAESFGALADQYTEDAGSKGHGGLYENVAQGEMVAEFNDWLYNDARKAGDVEIIFSEDYGYHIMYYVGEGRVLRDVLAEAAIRSDKGTQYSEQTLKDYPVTELKGLELVK